MTGRFGDLAVLEDLSRGGVMIRWLGRRQFLWSAGVVGWAAPRGVRAKPGRKIRVALYGTRHGHSKGKLETLLQLPDFEVAGIFEPDAAVRAERARDPLFASVKWLSEEEILGDPSIELVVVECRVWEAIPWGRKVIAAGKHLHLEKPPGHEMQPFRELIEEARDKQLLVQMGYVWRHHAGISAALEAARQGWLGDVYLIRGTINKDLQVERRADWARYRGGTLFELGGHLIDRVVDLWGRPTKVCSWLRNDTLQDGLADNTLAVLEYPQSLAVISSAVWMAGSSRHRSFEVIGTDGSFLIQPIEPGTRVKVVLRTAKGPYTEGWQIVEFPPQPRYIGDFQELARALNSSTPLRYSYDYELLVHETLLRASGEMAEGPGDHVWLGDSERGTDETVTPL